MKIYKNRENKTTEIRTGLIKEAGCLCNDLKFLFKICDFILGPASFPSFFQLSIALYCSGVLISMHFNLANRIKGKYYLWPVLDLCYLYHPATPYSILGLVTSTRDIELTVYGGHRLLRHYIAIMSMTRNISGTLLSTLHT